MKISIKKNSTIKGEPQLEFSTKREMNQITDRKMAFQKDDMTGHSLNAIAQNGTSIQLVQKIIGTNIEDHKNENLASI